MNSWSRNDPAAGEVTPLAVAPFERPPLTGKTVFRFCTGLVLAVSAAGAMAADGDGLFLENCASCHGADGRGRTPAGKKIGAKDLTESKTSDAEILKQILDGTRDPKGNVRMPAFREKLSAEHAAALVDYVKSFRRKR